jgi:hypothetical protein
MRVLDEETDLGVQDCNMGDREVGSEGEPSTSEDHFNTVDDVIATIREAQFAPAVIEVSEVDDADSALTSAAPASRKLDKIRAEVNATGLTAEQVEKEVATRMVMKKGQRRLPLNVTVPSAPMIAFFDSRSDERIETDMIKGIRNDGGPQGPTRTYEDLLRDHGVDAGVAKRAAEALAAKVGHRIMAIRLNVVATTNELRRRRAITSGVEPASVKYLRVR